MRKNTTLRSDLSKRMQHLIDGNGAFRIADELFKSVIEID